MDMESEYEEFQKTHQPSLIGSSIRNANAPSGDVDTEEPEEVIKSRSRSRSRPVVKSRYSSENDLSLASLKQGGALLGDDETEMLDTILDEDGLVKEEAVQEKEKEELEDELEEADKDEASLSEDVKSFKEEKAKEESIPVIHTLEDEIAKEKAKENTEFLKKEESVLSLDKDESELLESKGDKEFEKIEEDLKISDEKKHDHIEIFGGDASRFIAPASSINGGIESPYPLSSPSINKSVEIEKQPELFTSQDILTVDEILKKVNDGKFEEEQVAGDSEKEKKGESGTEASDEKNDKENHSVNKELEKIKSQYPEVPSAVLEADSEFTAPASAREGSDSKVLASRSTSRQRHSTSSPAREGSGLYKPNLARGDSYHSGLNPLGLASSHPGTPGLDLNNSEVFERRPRHEPGTTRTSASDSSKEYLRKISRSRSRISNDKKVIGGIDNSSNKEELKQEGALMGDTYSQLDDLEDAINRALQAVEADADPDEQHEDLTEKHLIIKEEDEDEDEGDTSHKTNEKLAAAATEVEEPEVKDVSEVAEKEVEEKEEEVPKVQEKEDEEKEVVDPEDEEKEVVDPEDEEKEVVDPEVVDPEVEEKEVAETETEEPEEVEDESKEEEKEAELEEKKVEPEEESKEEPKEDPKEEEEEAAKDEVAEEEVSEPVSEPVSKSADADAVYVPKSNKMTFEDEPVYLYTSLAGGFQIATRTNRLTTILTANRVAFTYRDLGTDEEAKKIWRRYSSGKTLPGIVRGKDDYIGNWEDIEEANENYEVRSLIYESF
ncbi:unnamed protein product [[Candida] boidinii]|uniref:Unnamed protein product n=1 Tax=Candida boidinii TaxID=5477 RepID=A0A9W6WGX0_CANBO|nr:hypothetical protein B5S30_g3454 [[Candida] boidinii]GME69989.1 unnamed protein product [[Candida] boidinii]GMG00056.1 unnamed protein product [[Candida] boidinii]